MARDAVMASLRYLAELLDVTCPERLQPELHSAVGDLAEVAGYIAQDANAHQEARRVFRFGLAYAEKADDWLTATGRAMLHGSRARALAKMRRVQETLTAIGTAEKHFAHSTPANNPPFIAYYEAALLDGATGLALFDPAMLGHHPEQATTRLTTAVAESAADSARARAVWLTKLASLTMATGDPHHATTLGHQALDAAGRIRSHRTTEDLRDHHQHAAAHQNVKEITHLRQGITHPASRNRQPNPPGECESTPPT